MKLAMHGKRWEAMDGEPQIWKTQKVTLVKYNITSQNMEKKIRIPLTMHLHILGKSYFLENYWKAYPDHCPF